jgi:prevent-host-death family protein
MTSVGITELKAHLSEYLRRTQNGERFYVTYRGAEVAELGPPDPVRAALLRMAAKGEIEWSGETPRLPDGFHPNPGRPVSDLVLEDRGPYLPEADHEAS